MVTPNNGKTILEQALLAAPMFMTRWRWNANRSLAILRQRGGKRVPPPIQRMRADDLMVKLFPQQMACRENLPQGDVPIPDHPLVFQTVFDCLHEAMDVDGWLNLLKKIEGGQISITAVDTREPSPFSYEILNANPYAFLDDAPLEERRARAVSTRRTLTIESVRDIGKLDPHAIEQVKKEAWPLVRTPDELHEALSQVGMFPFSDGTQWEEYYKTLHKEGRALEVSGKEQKPFWVATELWPLVKIARPDFSLDIEPLVPQGVRTDWSASEAWTFLVHGRLELLGPTTVDKLSSDLGLDPSKVDSALSALESQGLVLRGHFNPNATEPEWCSRHLLTRIHRLTLDRLRRQVEPVTVEQFFQFLFRWHHLETGTQLNGPQGVASVIEKLQGFEIPAMAWEQIILPQRVKKYETRWLDELCLNGEVTWARISQPFAKTDDLPNRIRMATKILPISLMIREDLWWLCPSTPNIPPYILSHGAQSTLELLQKQGATFFPDLLKGTGLLPTQQEEALWELVAAGLITGDGFAGIRSLTNPLKKHQESVIRRLKRRGRAVHAVRRGAGRWTIFQTNHSEKQEQEEQTEAWAHQLLERYGILFRDLLSRDDCAPPWYSLRPILRRMEARGEVHGGRFVSGVSGEQYGLPDAVEMLRHIRKESPEPAITYVSGVDPLNLIGIITPGSRLPALSFNIAAFYGGSLVGSTKGGEVWVSENLKTELTSKVFQILKSGRLLNPYS
jgi:ATP-dependent Lhr-like helicase